MVTKITLGVDFEKKNLRFLKEIFGVFGVWKFFGISINRTYDSNNVFWIAWKDPKNDNIKKIYVGTRIMNYIIQTETVSQGSQNRVLCGFHICLAWLFQRAKSLQKLCYYT